MKGLFFSEFVEMVENVFSPELADAIIEESTLPSGGVYTAGGNYDYKELLQLVDKLSEKTGIPLEKLIHDFGDHLFERLSLNYPEFVEGSTTAFDFLCKIEDHIHTEIRKIYPDSEMATFDTCQPDRHSLVMTYTSPRPFAALALGLLRGCARHFGENISIEWEDLSTDDVSQFRFTLKSV